MQIKYRLSPQARQFLFVETGTLPPADQVIDIDLAALTPVQRQPYAILLDIDKNQILLYEQPYLLNTDENLAQALAAAISAKRKSLTTSVNQSIKSMALALEGQQTTTNLLSPAEIANASYIEIDLGLYYSVLADYQAALPAIEAAAAKREAARRTEEAAMKAHWKAAEAEAAERKAADQSRRAAEKEAWIEAHGSDHLKAACIKYGYDCQRMYVTERAEAEYPGFKVDFADELTWKSRSCPSVKALAALEALPANAQAEIVWLTGIGEDYEYEPEEALIVRNYLDKYDLYKTF